MKIHLIEAGEFRGESLCGEISVRGIPAAYWNERHPDAICPACLKRWRASEDQTKAERKHDLPRSAAGDLEQVIEHDV